MGEFGRARRRAPKTRIVGGVPVLVDFVVLAGQAVLGAGTAAAATLQIARLALLDLVVGVVVEGALILALFPLLVVGALLTNQLVEAVAGAQFTSANRPNNARIRIKHVCLPWMTFPANRFPGHRLERFALLGSQVFVVVAVGTALVLAQAIVDGGVLVHGGLLA